MRICLINPPDNKNISLKTKTKKSMNVVAMPHLGLAYIAKTLENNGFFVDIIECEHEELTTNDVCKIIINENYDAVGLSTYSYNYNSVSLIAKRIHKMNNNIFIFLGGYYSTFMYNKVLKELPEINCCVVGEGEITTLEVMKSIQSEQPIDNIRGIAYSKENSIYFTGKRELIKDLDILPFPKRSFIPENNTASIITSRGCYGKCNYCSVHSFYQTCDGSSVRRRSPENVVNEIEELVKLHNIEYVNIIDDNFAVSSEFNRNWLERFCSLIKDKNIKIEYMCEIRANEIVASKDMIKKFMEIGLCKVFIGVESMAQNQLDFFNKKTTVQQNIQAIKVLDELNVNFKIGFLLFDPAVTVDTILESLNTLKGLNLHKSRNSGLMPISIRGAVVSVEGTPLFDYVMSNNLYAQNELNYNFFDEQTKLLYDIVLEWSNHIKAIFFNDYIYKVVKTQCGDRELELIQQLYNEMYYIDLEFIINTCENIVTGNISKKEDVMITKEKWLDCLANLGNKFEQLEKSIIREGK